jgi:hypothetical protein
VEVSRKPVCRLLLLKRGSLLKTDEMTANLLGLCLLCVAVVSGLTGLALVLWGRCPPLSPQGAQARLIPRLGLAVCLHRRVFLALNHITDGITMK